MILWVKEYAMMLASAGTTWRSTCPRSRRSCFQKTIYLMILLSYTLPLLVAFSLARCAIYFKSYSSLSVAQRIEWNNRVISTVHAIFITIVSMYFAFWSDLFSDNRHERLLTFRSSSMSTFALGVSVGYFLSDLGMIFWFYPSLGGTEYVVHHLLSIVAVTYAMLTGEGQLYTFMILISETTTPGINLRWYLDAAGMKRSRAYLINGILIFLTWLVARILLFMYLFYHIYSHYDQVKQMQTFGYLLVVIVPSVLSLMNLMWFGKIIKGVKKTIAKRH